MSVTLNCQSQRIALASGYPYAGKPPADAATAKMPSVPVIVIAAKVVTGSRDWQAVAHTALQRET